MPIERAEINRANLPARRARERKPRDTGGDRGADCGIEPEFTPDVPYTDDLLRISDRLAVRLDTLRISDRTRGDALSFLRSAVRAHGPRLGQLQHSSRNSASTHFGRLGPSWVQTGYWCRFVPCEIAAK